MQEVQHLPCETGISLRHLQQNIIKKGLLYKLNYIFEKSIL